MRKIVHVWLVVSGLLATGVLAEATDGLPLKIRVGTYNVGHFNQGKLGGYQEADAKEAAERWHKWIKKESFDVFFVQEWNRGFDKAETLDATNLLLKPVYDSIAFGERDANFLWIYNGIATNFKIKNVRQVQLTHKYYYAILADWEVGGLTVTLISVHVPWQGCCHETSIDALIEELKKHPYFICGGDLNSPDRNVLKIKAAGFNVANGGDEGWFCTVAKQFGKKTKDVNIDNIITSTNIKIRNVSAPFTGLNDEDHLPVITDVVIGR